MADGEREQAERLVVKIERRVADLTVEIHDRCDAAVGPDELAAQIVERMPGGLAPGPVPPEPAGLAIDEHLPGDGAGALWRWRRAAREIDRLVKAAAGPIGAHRPPQRQRDVAKPAPELSGLGGQGAHPSGRSRHMPQGETASVMPEGSKGSWPSWLYVDKRGARLRH